MRLETAVFVGREHELTLLDQRARAAAQGVPSVGLIVGSAGSGKSELVREVRRRSAGWPTITVEADAAAVDASMYVARQLEGVTSSAPVVGSLEVLGHLAQRQADGPVLFVIEDLHWADLASRRTLLMAVRRLEGDRVLTLVTTREEGLDDRDGWSRLIDDSDRCVYRNLGALNEADVATLAEAHGVQLGPGGVARLKAHTGGHALYERTLLRELTPEQLSAPEPLPAPRTLAMTVAARAAAASAAANDLLAALAVLNAPTPLTALSTITGIEDPTGALEEGLATGLIEIVPGASPLTVRFAHPLYQTALYDEINLTRRRRLHVAAAHASTARVSALLHRVAAADRTDDVLADELQSVAERLDDAPMAARLLADAAALSSRPDYAVDRVLAAGRVLLKDHRSAAMRQLVPRLEACPPSAGRDLLLGWSAWQVGNAGPAEDLLRRTADDTGAPPVDRAAASLQLSMLHLTRGRGAAAIASATEVIDAQVLPGAEEELAWALLAAGVGQRDGGALGLAVLDERFPDRRTGAHPNAHVVFVTAMMCTLAGFASDALAMFDVVARPDRIDSLSGRFGDRRAQINVMQAVNRYRIGDWDRALAHAHAAIDVATDEAQAWPLAQGHGVTAMIYAGRGEFHRAAQRLDLARQGPAADVPDTEVILRLAGAAIGRAAARPADVVAALAPLADRQRSRLPLAANLQFWPCLITAYLDLRQVQSAVASAQLLRELAHERHIAMGMHLNAIDALIALSNPDPARATAHFENAVRAMAGDEDILDRIAIHHAFGRHLRARGRRREANGQLATARNLALAISANPYINRIEGDMGATTAARPTHGQLDVLTDRERDVVALVNNGLTNQEVADTMYVSRKAVEYHLGNVYAKLHVKSRRELKALLAEP